MRRFARPKPLILILSVIALIVLIAIGQYLRLFERAWFDLHYTAWQPMSAVPIGLDQYQVAVERVIEGLDDDVSALTFDPVRKSLFTVADRKPADRAVAGRADYPADRAGRLRRPGGGGVHRRQHPNHRRVPSNG